MTDSGPGRFPASGDGQPDQAQRNRNPFNFLRRSGNRPEETLSADDTSSTALPAPSGVPHGNMPIPSSPSVPTLLAHSPFAPGEPPPITPNTTNPLEHKKKGFFESLRPKSSHGQQPSSGDAPPLPVFSPKIANFFGEQPPPRGPTIGLRGLAISNPIPRDPLSASELTSHAHASKARAQLAAAEKQDDSDDEDDGVASQPAAKRGSKLRGLFSFGSANRSMGSFGLPSSSTLSKLSSRSMYDLTSKAKTSPAQPAAQPAQVPAVPAKPASPKRRKPRRRGGRKRKAKRLDKMDPISEGSSSSGSSTPTAEGAIDTAAQGRSSDDNGDVELDIIRSYHHRGSSTSSLPESNTARPPGEDNPYLRLPMSAGPATSFAQRLAFGSIDYGPPTPATALGSHPPGAPFHSPFPSPLREDELLLMHGAEQSAKRRRKKTAFRGGPQINVVPPSEGSDTERARGSPASIRSSIDLDEEPEVMEAQRVPFFRVPPGTAKIVIIPPRNQNREGSITPTPSRVAEEKTPTQSQVAQSHGFKGDDLIDLSSDYQQPTASKSDRASTNEGVEPFPPYVDNFERDILGKAPSEAFTYMSPAAREYTNKWVEESGDAKERPLSLRYHPAVFAERAIPAAPVLQDTLTSPLGDTTVDFISLAHRPKALPSPISMPSVPNFSRLEMSGLSRSPAQSPLSRRPPPIPVCALHGHNFTPIDLKEVSRRRRMGDFNPPAELLSPYQIPDNAEIGSMGLSPFLTTPSGTLQHVDHSIRCDKCGKSVDAIMMQCKVKPCGLAVCYDCGMAMEEEVNETKTTAWKANNPNA